MTSTALKGCYYGENTGGPDDGFAGFSTMNTQDFSGNTTVSSPPAVGFSYPSPNLPQATPTTLWSSGNHAYVTFNAPTSPNTPFDELQVTIVQTDGSSSAVFNFFCDGTNDDGTYPINTPCTLTILLPPQPTAPTAAVSPSPPTITIGSTSTLTFTLSNSLNPSFALSGVADSVTLPSGLAVAATPNAASTCGGTFSPAASAGTLSLSGGAIAAGGSCTFNVDVTPSTPGTKTIPTGTPSATSASAGSAGTSATLTVNALAPTVTVSPNPTTITTGGNSTLTFTLTNPNSSTALAGVADSVTLPSGLAVATTPNAASTCGGTFSPAASATSLSLASGTIAAGGSCTFNVDVTPSTSGTKTIPTGTPSATGAATGTAGTSATLNVNAIGAPTVTVSPSPTTITTGGISTITFTLTNPNSSTALSGVADSVTLPTGLAVAATPNAASTCGGTFSPAASAGTLSLTGGALASNASCTFNVDVTPSTSGTKTIPTGTPSATSAATGTAGTSATLNVNAIGAPTVTVSPSPTTITAGGISTITFTLTNPNSSTALAGVADSVTLPSGLTVATTPNAASTCGGTFSPAANATSLSLTGGALAANASCTFNVDVTPSTSGTKTIPTGTPSATSAATGTAGTSATLNVNAPGAPTVTVSPSPTTITTGGISTLTFTLSNPNSSVVLSGVADSVTLPTGLAVAATPNAASTCGGTFSPAASDSTLSLTGGALAANASCTFNVDVTPSTSGAKTIPTGTPSATGAAAGTTGTSATLNVNVLGAPTVTVSPSPTTITTGGISTLTFTLTNPNSSVALSGVADSITLPTNLTVATTPNAASTCGGTFSPAANATSLSLSGGAIAAGGSCTFNVDVTPSTSGAKTIPTGTPSATSAATGTTGTAATLNVNAPGAPTVTVSPNPTTITTGGISTLTFTLTNPNSSVALSGVADSVTLPTGLTVAATPNAASTCGGTFSPAANATSLSLTGGTLAANASCTFNVDVTPSTSGTKTIPTGTPSATGAAAGTTGTSATLNVNAPGAPTVTVSPSPTTITTGGISTLTFTLTNPNSSVALSGVADSVTLPTGLAVASAPNAASTCGGTFSPAASAGTLSLTGGTLAANASCTFNVDVTPSTSGTKTIPTGTPSATGAATGTAGTSATLNVNAALTTTQAVPSTTATAGTPVTAFTPVTAAGGTGTLSYALSGATLPTGLNFSTTTGQITGTPATALTTTIFTVTATDQTTPTAQTSAKTFSLTVSLPAFTFTPPAGALPNATAGAAYSQTVASSGGTAPYTYSVTAGALPAGLVLAASTGVISGTPTVSGSFGFTVTAHDAHAVTGTVLYSLTVAQRPDPSKDAEVIGVVNAQAQAAQHFASTQITNFNDRLESLHDDDCRQNSFKLAMNDSRMPADTDPMRNTSAAGAVANIGTGNTQGSSQGSSQGNTSWNNWAGNTTSNNAGPFGIALNNANTGGGDLKSSDAFAYNGNSDGNGRRGRITAKKPDNTDASPQNGCRDDANKRFAAWTGGYVNFGKLSSTGTTGIDYLSTGVSAGADYRFSSSFTAGFGFGFGNDKSSIGANGTTSNGASYDIAAYGSWHPTARTFVDALIGYGIMNFNSNRYITGSSGAFAEGLRSGHQIFGSVTSGYEFKSRGFLISPYGRISTSWSVLDAFTESGGGIMALQYGSQTVRSLTGGFGLRTAYDFKEAWGTFTPRLRIEYAHEFEGSSTASITYADLAGIGGTIYNLPLSPTGSDYITTGIGADLRFLCDWIVGLDYRTSFGQEKTAPQMVRLKLGRKF